jgi:uncharacterized protein
MKRLALFLLGLTALVPFTARGVEAAIPAAPERFVTDEVGFISTAMRLALDSQLYAFAHESGHQLVVYIAATSQPLAVEDWASKAFRDWKIGRKEQKDGLLLVVMANDQKMRIEVGYGLEGLIPDITAGRIINDIMVPLIRSGDHDGALRDGVNALIAAAGGGPEMMVKSVATQPAPVRQKIKPPSKGQLIVYIIIGIVFLILFITNPSLAIYLLLSIFSGGSGGRGGGGGGGFSGGGGSSGGGGASGSW